MSLWETDILLCTLKLCLAEILRPAGKVLMYDSCDDSRKELVKEDYIQMRVGC